MGKAGRVACIFTPYVLTIASLICLIFVGLGCTRTNSPLNEIFFIKVSSEYLLLLVYIYYTGIEMSNFQPTD